MTHNDPGNLLHYRNGTTNLEADPWSTQIGIWFSQRDLKRMTIICVRAPGSRISSTKDLEPRITSLGDSQCVCRTLHCVMIRVARKRDQHELATLLPWKARRYQKADYDHDRDYNSNNGHGSVNPTIEASQCRRPHSFHHVVSPKMQIPSHRRVSGLFRCLWMDTSLSPSSLT
jgi:hypothetical protein